MGEQKTTGAICAISQNSARTSPTRSHQLLGEADRPVNQFDDDVAKTKLRSKVLVSYTSQEEQRVWSDRW